MEYLITGVSNKTLPIEIREKISVRPDRQAGLLARLLATEGVSECLLLSTCNRTEIHAVAASAEVVPGLKRALCDETSIAPGNIGGRWYAHANGDAVRHLFRVASSLDSMVVGEPQIFSQLKDAYRLAFGAGSTGNIINQIMHRAFFVAKRVRTETGIGLGSTSVSSIAVDLIESSVCQRYAPTLLIVGTGDVGASAARTFKDRGLGKLILVNRTRKKADELASELGAEIGPWEKLCDLMEHADAVITSCGTGAPTLTSSMIGASRVGASRSQLVIIDLGVPRDVEPEAGAIPGVALYNIDDLKQSAERNLDQRRREVAHAEEIVAAEAKRTSAALLESGLEPTIARLMQKCEEIRKKELERAFDRLGEMPPEHRQVVDVCTTSIISKILHDPIITLKKGALAPEHRNRMLDFFRHIFGLE
ncbi:MAG: glutamyl-tRNA reductase [Pseudomonadota bacterium]